MGKNLLEGKGKRMRHVKIRSVEEAISPAVQNLVKAARADAPKSLAIIHKKRSSPKAKKTDARSARLRKWTTSTKRL